MSKTLQGHRTITNYQKEQAQALIAGGRRQTIVAVQYNYDRLMKIERRPKKYSLQVTE